MGRERTRSGKHLHVYITYLISIVLLGGCSNLVQVQHHLRRSQQFVQAGNFDGALIENEKALLLLGERPPADEALFNLALIYAHGDNPKRDYRRTLEYFDRLESRHPASSYTAAAKVWRSLVEDNRKLARELAKRRLMLKRAWDDNRKATELLEKHNVAIENSENERRKLNEELEKLNQMILDSRQVDIDIEEKKRQTAQ